MAHKVLIDIPKVQVERIDVEARAAGISRSDWIRRACSAYLDANTASAVSVKVRETKAKEPLKPQAVESDAELLARIEAIRKELGG